MKTTLVFTLIFITLFTFLPNAHAVDTTKWGLPDGAKLRLGKGRVGNIAYSPDGTRLAVGSSIGVWIYDTETGEELHLLFDENSFSARGTVFSPDGKTIASTDGGETFHLWDTNTGERLQSITAHTPPPGSYLGLTNLVFSPDGKTIASTGYHDRTIRLWDVATGAHLRTLEHPYYSVNKVMFSPDGNTLVSVEGVDFDIHLWDTNTGEHLQTLTAQASRSSSVAFSPDGNTLAIGNASVENIRRIGIIMWDIATGTHLRTIAEGHSFNKFAFSPDGNTIAIVTHHEGIGLWDVNTGEHLRWVATHPEGVIGEGVYGIAFSTDGSLMCFMLRTGNIHLWRINMNRHQRSPLRTPTGDTRYGGPSVFSYSPNGSRFAKGGSSTIGVWNANTGKFLRHLTGDTTEQTGEYYDSSQNFRFITFNHDGSLLAATGRARTFRFARSDSWITYLWDTNTGRLLHKFIDQFSIDRRFSNMALSPDGSLLAISWDFGLDLWDVATGERLQRLTGDGNERVNSVVFSPDGSLLAISWSGETTSLWDVATGERLQTLTGSGRVWFSPDGSLLAGFSSRGIGLWDVATGERLQTFIGGAIGHITFSSDGSLLVHTGSFAWEVNTDRPPRTITGYTNVFTNPRFMSDGSLLVAEGVGIGLWDVNTGEHLRILTEHSNKNRSNIVEFSAFSPDGSLLAGSGGFSKILCLWDASTGKLLRTFTGHTANVRSVMFSPDGNTLASGDFDGTIHLWDANTGELLRTLIGHTTVVVSMAFSPDGNTLTSSGFRDPDIRVWDANTSEQLHILTGHTLGGVESVVFSPDGSLLASGGYDATVRVWDANTWEHLRTLTGHKYFWASGGVESVAFSPDGNTLASAGSTERSIRLWDVATGAHLRTLEGHKYSFESVAFSPDGNTLASTGQGIGLLWEITPTSPHPSETAADVNGDGFVNLLDVQVVDSRMGMTGEDTSDDKGDADVNGNGIVNIADLALVTQILGDVNGNSVVNLEDLNLISKRLGETGKNTADINADGIVNIADLVIVAGNALSHTAAAAPATYKQATALLTVEQVQQWLNQARLLGETSPIYRRGILALEQLLTMLTPKQTSLLPNYPNPFNPETWIPYQLARPADVKISIYAVDGKLVRTLDLGHRLVGIYKNRSRAAHWDGRNALGESVASGIYFYEFTAGEFTATRKMLIRK